MSHSHTRSTHCLSLFHSRSLCLLPATTFTCATKVDNSRMENHDQNKTLCPKPNPAFRSQSRFSDRSDRPTSSVTAPITFENTIYPKNSTTKYHFSFRKYHLNTKFNDSATAYRIPLLTLAVF